MRLSRRLLYGLATNDRFEAAVQAHPWLRQRAFRAASRYVAGTTLDDALCTLRGLHQEGMAASLDLFGESLNQPEAIDGVVAGYVDAAKALETLGADVYLEVVPSHLGIEVSADSCRRNVERVLDALPHGSRLEISAEDSSGTDRVMEVVLALAKAGAPVMPTVPANLRRSVADVDRLIEAGLPVRLVKGAYVEPRQVSYSWGDETDLAFVRLAHRVWAGGAGLAIATHDPVIRESLLLGLPGVGGEMLLGVRRDDARDLVRRGHQVRVYVPYGEHWVRYWMRRVAESRGA
jgi:proline dehydrogenase